MANSLLSTKAEGSVIKINENGRPVEFIVCKHDYESELNGSGRTLVVRKDCYDSHQWHSSNVNAYATSDIDAWFNSTYKNLLDADIRGAIGTTKFKYTPGNGNNTVGTLERAIFSLSATELNRLVSWVNLEGTALEIASSLQIAYMNGSAVAQWTRSPLAGSTGNAVYLTYQGNVSNGGCTGSRGARPAFTLSSDTIVDDSGNVTIPDLTAHKALINGTAYEVKGGKCLVNGTIYDIKKGRTLIGGTGYDITLPGIGIMVSTLSVGQSVYMKVNGTAKEFIVVHQGKPSSIYDDSCNGTWLLMKDIYENRQWNSSDVNKLESSTIHAYLNSTFLDLFDSNIKDAIKQVKIPYRKNGGSDGTTQQGVNGLPCKVFLLSAPEVHYEHRKVDSGEGAALSYFASCATNAADSKRVASMNHYAKSWWTRSPRTNYTSYAWGITSKGDLFDGHASDSYGIRPAFIIRSDALIDADFNIIT